MMHFYSLAYWNCVSWGKYVVQGQPVTHDTSGPVSNDTAWLEQGSC